ncbi:MAG TPA: hypothetical protein PK405_01605 [Hyphomicrobiales bacterium]|nr:hypothetical protein [Hyphomicrobiales bacterium]
MKAFVVAVAAAIVISVGAAIVLELVPMSTSDMMTTANVRLH